jgi:hypothetical protein
MYETQGKSRVDKVYTPGKRYGTFSVGGLTVVAGRFDANNRLAIRLGVKIGLLESRQQGESDDKMYFAFNTCFTFNMLRSMVGGLRKTKTSGYDLRYGMHPHELDMVGKL